MTIDLFAFDKEAKKIEVKLGEVTLEKMQKVALTIDSVLVLSTPVDKGRARANWLPSLNQPETKVLEEEDKTGTKTISKAEALMLTVNIDDTIYISNNVPYIGKLNDGYSKQAPKGFVEKAVQVGGNI